MERYFCRYSLGDVGRLDGDVLVMAKNAQEAALSFWAGHSRNHQPPCEIDVIPDGKDYQVQVRLAWQLSADPFQCKTFAGA